MEKESYKIIFDPMHPDSIKDGELKGYTLYPDIDIMKEYNDVLEMVEILKLINNIKQNYQADCGN
jgi:flagellar basal body rod protein FlgC